MARSRLHQLCDDHLRAIIARLDREAQYRPATGHERQQRLVAAAILDRRARQRQARGMT